MVKGEGGRGREGPVMLHHRARKRRCNMIQSVTCYSFLFWIFSLSVNIVRHGLGHWATQVYDTLDSWKTRHRVQTHGSYTCNEKVSSRHGYVTFWCETRVT